MEQRWRGRWALSALVRSAVFALPIAASVGAGAVVSRALPRPHNLAAQVFWWIALLAMVTFVLVAVERLARRALPLAALLRLSLIFPDRAPSRFRMAVRAGGTRKLEERLKSAAEDVLPDTPSEAAEKVLELAALLNVHDRRTRGHSERVRVYADLLADELALSSHDRSRLHWAALLHDIGKLVVPQRILNKAGAPDEAEWEVLRRHPLEGERFIEPLRGWLGEWAAAVGQHHERYDGGGYPRGLAGQQISMAARIVAVADSYEVMTAARAYKKAMPAAEARRELARCAGSQFDPNVVRAFLNISLGRLRLAMGPLAWLAQIPVVASAPSLGSAATSAVGTAAAGVATSTAIVLGGVAEPPVELSPPAAAVAEDAVHPAPPPQAPTAGAAGPRSGGVARPAGPPPSGPDAPPPPSSAAPTTTASPGVTAPGQTRRTEVAPAKEQPAADATTATSRPTTTTAAPTTTSAPTTTVVVTAPPTTAPAPTTAPPPTKPPESDADRDRGRGNDGGTSAPAVGSVGGGKSGPGGGGGDG